jgi:hypothetical protein
MGLVDYSAQDFIIWPYAIVVVEGVGKGSENLENHDFLTSKKGLKLIRTF